MYREVSVIVNWDGKWIVMDVFF
ncbi:hypothetical protein OIU74_030009 [Salix koriyanagi]|uniref:Uncharacterized protein n=1 Tax=Salix koriyanagi TaxID=2511006 RepID=A0A9Q0VFK1_9ROSI|nr:hypothetical protein OIU74_030009 [Salix koriyanagi]